MDRHGTYRLLNEACCSACARAREEAEPQTPASVKRCVTAVAKEKTDGDVQRAFAICVAAGQKQGTLKKGTIEPTGKGKKVDAAKASDPDHDTKVADYEKLLATARKKRSENVSIRSDMMKLLGEDDGPVAGPTSTGKANKPAKKTPKDSVKIPTTTSGADDEALGVDQKPNSAAKKLPLSKVSPPNVQTSAFDDMRRMARIFSGIDSKYELGDTMKPIEQDDTIVSESAESDDPILKLALEGMRDPHRHHPFE